MQWWLKDSTIHPVCSLQLLSWRPHLPWFHLVLLALVHLPHPGDNPVHMTLTCETIFRSWPRHMLGLFFSAGDSFFQRLMRRVDGITLTAPHIWPFPTNPATAAPLCLGPLPSTSLWHRDTVPPGAAPSLTRREAITSTLYIHLPSIHRVELIAGCICPSFRWVRMKSSDPSLPGVVHLDLS